jgi:hypothetical protein
LAKSISYETCFMFRLKRQLYEVHTCGEFEVL